MALAIRLSREALQRFAHVRDMDTQQITSDDHNIRSGEDISYTIMQINPVYPDLILAVKQSSLEFYNAGTLARAEGIATEDLYTFKIKYATFLPGGMTLSSKNTAGPKKTGVGGPAAAGAATGGVAHELVVLYACDWAILEKSIYAYSLTSRSIIAMFTGHKNPITTLVASPVPGASTFLSGSSEGMVILWGPDVKNGGIHPLERYMMPECENGPVCAFDWSGKIFVVCAGKRIFFFNVSMPMAPFKKFEFANDKNDIMDVCISPHNKGDMTAFRVSTGDVYIVDSMNSYKIIATINDAKVKNIGKGGMSFSSDGLTLLIPSDKLLAVPLSEIKLDQKIESPLNISPVIIPVKDETPVVARFLPGSACIITAGDTIGVYQYEEKNNQ